MVAITVFGIVVGALIGVGSGVLHGNISTTGVRFYGIGGSGMAGGAAGGAAGSCLLALGSYARGFGRTLTKATHHAGRFVYLLAALGGGCCALTVMCLQMSRFNSWYDHHESLIVNITLMVVFGVAAGVAAGTLLGSLIGSVTALSLLAVVLLRITAGLLSPSVRKKPEAAKMDPTGDADDPLLVRAAAALMPSHARRRWQDDFREASYDYEESRHADILRNFLLHAPAVVFWAWVALLQHRVLGVGASPGNRQ
ncbi:MULTISPECIES: hypothetical protein [Streptomyces]|uniref:Uncharacterized protein n=1 Tax=Streptomyces lasalocidi TaxID=324833 RepID=A0A4U5W5G4_STRLS|nr:hypothetical protein [Streptomyces lasalocidi]TKS96141.1 hypothetical protein E4U91_35865 [Streptomyces lasalocidi]